MSKKTTALTVIGERFPVLGGGEVAELINENLEGESLDPSDLEVIKVPGSGGTFWLINGEAPTEELECIILHHKLTRAYWPESIDDSGGGDNPECSSDDSITGRGEPGGECISCPFAQYGSAEKGDGQACKQVRRLFVLRAGDMMPSIVNVPPTSLKASKKHMLKLVNKGLHYRGAITKMTLEKVTSKKGIEYARIVFEICDTVPAEHSAQLSEFAVSLKGAISIKAAS